MVVGILSSVLLFALLLLAFAGSSAINMHLLLSQVQLFGYAL